MLSRIRETAEQAKIRLSTEMSVEIALPFLTPGFSFSYRLERAELERLDRKSTRLNSSHIQKSRMPSSA